jgi:hypothetical protein
LPFGHVGHMGMPEGTLKPGSTPLFLLDFAASLAKRSARNRS